MDKRFGLWGKNVKGLSWKQRLWWFYYPLRALTLPLMTLGLFTAPLFMLAGTPWVVYATDDDLKALTQASALSFISTFALKCLMSLKAGYRAHMMEQCNEIWIAPCKCHLRNEQRRNVFGDLLTTSGRSYHHTAEDLRVPNLAWGPTADIRAHWIHPEPSARTKRQEAGAIAKPTTLDPDQRRRDISPALRRILRRRSHLGHRKSASPIPRARGSIRDLPFDPSRLDADALVVLVLCLPHTHLLRRLPADRSRQRRPAGQRPPYWSSLPQEECERCDLGS